MRKNLKQYDFYWLLKMGFISMFFLQVVYLIIFNLTQLKYHIGYDASSYYLKAMEMGKQRTIFIDYWIEQTTLFFDSPVPLAAVIFYITGDIFISYGIANIIISAVFLSIFYLILCAFERSFLSKIVCLNMVACVYISPSFNNANDLGYVSSMFSSGNWYVLRSIIILMLIKVVMDLEEHKFRLAWIIVSGILLVVSGISGGWYLLVTIILPLIAYYIIRMFIKNTYKEVWNIKVLLLVLGGMLVAFGKWIAVYKLNFISKDSNMVLVGLTDFWKNIGSIVLGFMDLISALPHHSDQNALQIEGIIYLMGFFVFLLCVIGFVFAISQVRKNRESKNGMLVCVAGFNILMFTVLYTTYGAEIFESRYLIPVFLLLVIMAGAFADALDDKLILKKWGFVLVFMVYAVLNIYDDSVLYKTKNNYDILASVAEKAAELEAPVVYVVGDNLNIDSRNLRVIDKDRIYKNINENSYSSMQHWGDYTYLDDAADVPGKNVMITTQEYYGMIPEYIRNKYVLQEQIDQYEIYAADVNRFDLKSGISGEYGLDYPTSTGFSVAGGAIDDVSGSFVSDGTTEGFVIWGPYETIKSGNYEFILNYEILDCMDQTAEFIVSIDAGNDVLGSVVLDKEKQQAVVRVAIDQDCDGLEYKVYNYTGTILNVHSFEIVKK